MKKKSRILKSFLATASIYGTFLTSFNAAGATVITTGDSVSLNTGAGLVGGIFNDGDTIQIEANNIPTPIISADKPNVKIGEITTLINDLIFGGVEVSQNTSIGPLNAADGLNPNFGPLKFMVDNVTATITGVGNQSFSSIDFAGKNSTLEINDTLAITTAIDNIGAENNGIINLGNNTSVTQAIGNNNSVSAVNVNGTGDITLGGAVNATSLNINNADANVIVQGQITGEVLYTQPGTLNVSGDNSIIGKVNFQNVDDTLKIRLNINESFNADIDNIVPGENGIVNVIQDKDPLVANSYIKGNIGETNPIQKLVISNDSEVSVIFQLDGKVKASKIQITRPNWDITPNPRMRLTINNDVTADIEGISDGSNNFELIINSGKTVTGAIDSINTRSTTINLRGNVTGPITNATTINFDGEGDSNLGSTANSTDFIVANAKANVTAAGLMTGNLSYNAAGTVTATKGITGDVDFAGIDGTLIVGDGQTITGSVDSKAGIGGILEFAGKGAVTGGIGGTNQLTRLRFSGAGDSTIPAAKAETYEIANADANITANGPLEGDILYSADGEFVVNGVTGDVTSSAADQGTLTVNSGNVTGTIGDNKNGLKLVNIGANPVTLFSNAFAPIALTNAASDLILADNVIVNGAVTTKNDTKGILTLGTNSSVTNGIGAAGSSLAQVNIGAGASSLGGDIYAGAVQLMADDSALTLEANTKVYGSVTTKTDTKGVLVLGQNSSVAGIGANGFSLERVEVGAGASSLGGNIYAGSVSLTADDSALTLEDNAKVYGSVTTKTNEKGVLVLGQNSSANGIGANNFSLERVEVGAGASSLGGDIYAGAVQLNEETSALTLEANTKVYGSVTTKTDTKGVLILGQGSSAAGIGANNFSLERVEVGAGASSLGGEIYAGAVKLMADDSALTLEDNAKVHGSVTTNTNEKGVLVLGQNSSVAGIGANGLSLERVEVGAGASSLGGEIYAGAVKLMADDSALTLEDNAKVHGSVTTNTNEKGVLVLGQNSSVAGIGANGLSLERVEVGAGASSLGGEIYAGAVKLMADDSALTLEDNAKVHGSVTTNTNEKGVLVLGQNSSVAGIGANGLSLERVEVGAGASSLGGEIYAGAVKLNEDDSALTLEDNAKVHGSVTTNTNEKGVLVLGQNSSVAGIGANGLSLERVEVGAGASSLGGEIYAGAVKLNEDDSALTLEDNAKVHGSVTTNTNEKGVLVLGQNSSVAGIGANGLSLERVEVGAGASSLGGEIYAGAVKLMADDSALTLEDNAKVHGSVTTNTNEKGVLVLGQNSSVAGIGANGLSLERVEVGAGASSLGGEIYAGAVKLNEDDSALTLEDNATIHGSVTTKTDTKGVLILGQGSSAAGIGANNFSLERVEVGAGASSLGGEIYAGAVQLMADDSALTLQDNAKVYGSITTKTDTKGVLVLGQNSSVAGIGAAGLSLERVEVGAGASSLGGEIYAGAVKLNEDDSALTLEDNATIHGSVTTKTDTKGVLILGQGSSAAGIGANNFSLERVEVGAGASSLGGEIYAGAVQLMADDSALTLQDNAKVYGSVTTKTDTKGVLVLGQNSSVAGIGAAGLSLERVEVGAGASSLGGDIYAGAVQLTADDSALTLQDNAKIYGSVTTANDSRGKLIFANDGTVTDNVGAAGSTLEEIEFNGVNKIQGTANAKTFIIANANAEVTVMGLMTGNVNYEADGTLAPEGIIGDIDFKGTNGTFNINAGFAIDGAVLSTGGLGGTLNFKGDGNVTGAIGTDDENSPALISVQGDDTTNVSLVDDGSVAR